MTMEGITLNLGLGTSPCVVTIADASGLAPLELPRAFAVGQQPPRPPSDDAVCRFEAALSAGAAPVDAKQAIQILRGIVPAPAVPSCEPIVAERPVPPVAPAAAETPPPVETPVAARTPVVAETPVVVERPVVAESHVAVEVPVIGKAPVPAAMPAVVHSAKTVELVAKPDVARAPSPLQQGQGGLAAPNTHGFANASVDAAKSVVTVETPVAEIPVIAERPVVVETPVAVQTPVSGKVPVPTATPVIAPSAEPATQEAVAKPDVARAPSPLQQGRGGLATPNTPGSAIASVVAAKSIVTVETPFAETPVIVEHPVVVETPVAVESPVIDKVPVPTATPVITPSAEPATQEAVAKPDVARASSSLQQGRGGLATPNTPGSAIASVGAAKSVVTVKTPVAETPVIAERPVVVETPVAVESPVIDKVPVPTATPLRVPSAEPATQDAVAKPDVARAPSPLQQGRGGLATPNTHGFANASVGAAKSVVTAETPVAEIPVVAERPVVVETPVAVESPVIDKVPVPTATPVIAPSAEPATQEAVAKPGGDGVPPPSAAGDGTPALPERQGFATASQFTDIAGETPAVIERPVVIERPAVLEQPVGVERQVAVETPTAAVPSSAVEAPRDEEDLESPAARIQTVPVAVTPPVAETAVPVAPEVAAASAATARTEAIRETVEQVVEAVAGQIVVTPALTHGEGNVRITLKPTVLDGSEISLTAQDGTLTVAIVPTTSEAERLAAAALPRLETALAEHVPAFRHVAVAVAPKKGKSDETA